MDPTSRFVALVQGPERDLPLDEAALLVAAHARPGLDPQPWLEQLDDLAATCPEPSFAALGRHLLVAGRFRGNTDAYGDPRNSMLDQVLERRTGIPITLSLVEMEVGRRVGIGVVGIGMPGHFLVRDAHDDDGFCDPFGGFRLLDRDGCRAAFDAVHAGTAAFDASLLAPVGPRSMLARLLANLERTALGREPRQSCWMLRLHLAIPDRPAPERVAVAEALAAAGRPVEAAAALEQTASGLGDEAADRVRARARALRASCN